VGAILVGLALLAFGGGAMLGVPGVFVSPLAVGVLVVRGELISRDPVPEHRFLTGGALAIAILVFCGLVGCVVRALLRDISASRRRAGLAAPIETP
jgi:hypothetical protein